MNIERQEREPCGVGLEQYKIKGECRKDLECVFGESELIGTCLIKSKMIKGYSILHVTYCKQKILF